MKCFEPHLEKPRDMTEFLTGLNQVFPENRCWFLQSLLFWNHIPKSDTYFSCLNCGWKEKSINRKEREITLSPLIAPYVPARYNLMGSVSVRQAVHVEQYTQIEA